MYNIINPDKFTYIDAPLKTVNEAKIRELNANILQNKFVTAQTIVPHFYNKTSFINVIANEVKAGGIIGPLNTFPSTHFQGNACPLGINSLILKRDLSNKIAAYPVEDFVVYYQLDKLKNAVWANATPTTNPPLYDNVVFCVTGYRKYPVTENTPSNIEDRMQHYTLIKTPSFSVAPTPTHNYDEWYYVKTLVVYNRAAGAASNRKAAPTTVCPCFVWDAANYYDLQDGKTKIIVGNFNGFITANFSAQKRPFPALWQLSDCLYTNIQRFKQIGQDVPFSRGTMDEIWKTSSLGDNIKFLVAKTPTAEKLYCRLNAEVGENIPSLWGTGADEDTYASSDDTNDAMIAFKTPQDFIDLMTDWGITNITDDIDDAKSLPSTVFPTGGYVPDGGGTSGYDDNPVIPNIPSFSDNTSDIIETTTPNITSINAASAYALSLTNVKTLFNWLMTDSFIDNISNLFSDKLSAINDLKIMPFDLVNHDPIHVENSTTLTLANVTGDIPCYKILPGYNYIVDGGSYKYTAYWGNFSDYSAATYYLYVPYGGVVELSPSLVVNSTISIKYALDIMTGNATAVIYSNDVFVKTVPCQIGQSVPITFTNTNQRDIKNALAALNVVNGVVGIAGNAAAGNVGGAISSGLGVVNTISGTALTNPLKVGSIGGFASGTAMLLPQTPFLIINRAQLSIPSELSRIAGRPSNIYSTINNFVGSGFVKVNVTHISTSATTEEQSQIINLLVTGIFL